MHALEDFWKNHLLAGDSDAFVLAAVVVAGIFAVVLTVITAIP